MAKSKEEREQRRLEAKERSEKRKAVKAAKSSTAQLTDSSKDEIKLDPNELRNNIPISKEHNSTLPALSLPIDALSKVMRYLPAREWGALSLTCTGYNSVLGGCRVAHLCSRLMRREDGEGKQSSCGSTCLVGGLELCSGRKEAMAILQRSFVAGGETNRLVSKKMKNSYKKNPVGDADADEYPGYARFVEEATIGYSAMQCSRSSVFPSHLQGRFASCSPEHTLLRIGGGGNTTSGPGGSGTATWGVGKRGQLGHGNREDVGEPRLLLGKIGWGIRIVQVAAGGGLVRVAHSLLLTSAGRVLSFGTAQYGQLGHGYDAGKQLSDCLRPRYIDALKNERCVCVAAGELHSGAVTIDGDVYTWGEGFCGQLGLGDRRPHLLPEQVTLGGLGDECVSNISCGCRHTLVVTEEGEVYSWGLGRFGVLGRSYTDFTYNNDIGMVVPDGEEGQVQGIAARAPPMPPAQIDAVVAAANEDNVAIDDLLISLDALNLTLDDPSDQCYPKVIDSLQGFRAVGVCAGHRHSMVLDELGGLYTFGSGASGALGHGDLVGQEFPVKIMEFEKNNVRIHQMSAGVDMSMAVSTTGDVYAWGKSSDGRLGLGIGKNDISLPRKVDFGDANFKAVDVECGYVHAIIVGLDGSVYQCGGVGIDGKDDGQDLREIEDENRRGYPALISGYNIWHRIAEPKEKIVKEKWSKYGKYELKGRSKMMNEGVRSIG
ncbi:hypothetical protein HJC23_001336 [Cyclotella cryptica]|uniref:F-box domain-containing protein n=1 Tax=Cyclotella cryptica TaxID=29204 RepID=A0ABD3NWI8_9STRA|eukprot:CCRYP_019176-RA/>CCRYP_019176-RA protein AED:0.03 eAED:0.03 QI:77/1/1/1/1/1/6/2462/714